MIFKMIGIQWNKALHKSIFILLKSNHHTCDLWLYPCCTPALVLRLSDLPLWTSNNIIQVMKHYDETIHGSNMLKEIGCQYFFQSALYRYWYIMIMARQYIIQAMLKQNWLPVCFSLLLWKKTPKINTFCTFFKYWEKMEFPAQGSNW